MMVTLALHLATTHVLSPVTYRILTNALPCNTASCCVWKRNSDEQMSRWCKGNEKINNDWREECATIKIHLS